MNRAYWEAVAADYEGEVMSVFDLDVEGAVLALIAAAGQAYPEGRAADLGCGVGKFTPALAGAFKSVEACDLSQQGVEATRARCRSMGNVVARQLDLAADPVPFDPADFVLCVNVLIMPSLDVRLRAWRAVTNQVACGGTLLLVVPSHESVQLEIYRALGERLDVGDSCAEALRRSQAELADVVDLQQGVHQLDGLRTKHYLREELETMLPDREFDVMELRKLVYSADGDSGSRSGTWDWLVVARRRDGEK